MTKHTDEELIAIAKHDHLTVAWAKSFGAAHDMMQDALKAISYHADNQDIGHVDFRMHAKRCADHTLEQCAGPPGILDPAPWPKPDWEDMASLRAALQAAEARARTAEEALRAPEGRALYWRNAYETLVAQTGRDLNDGYGVDPRKAVPSPLSAKKGSDQ